jgi:hypothetical protein
MCVAWLLAWAKASKWGAHVMIGRRYVALMRVAAVALVVSAVVAVPAMASARTIKLKASAVWDPDNYTSNGHPRMLCEVDPAGGRPQGRQFVHRADD